MINKLAFRNAKRSIKDYLVYLITMVVISSLMFAFNSMIFSKVHFKIMLYGRNYGRYDRLGNSIYNNCFVIGLLII
jgi:hypothetical protein